MLCWYSLYIVNYGQPNQLLLNDKNGSFVEKKRGSADTGSSYSQGVVAFDANGDGKQE